VNQESWRRKRGSGCSSIAGAALAWLNRYELATIKVNGDVDTAHAVCEKVDRVGLALARIRIAIDRERPIGFDVDSPPLFSLRIRQVFRSTGPRFLRL
jgi:hypothetical protein